jgi:hypothetical protein
MLDDPDGEREDALYQDSLTTEQHTSAALSQWAAAYGEEDPKSAWILTPYDIWMKNPHYSGPPVPHPEDDDFRDQEEGPLQRVDRDELEDPF